MGKVRTKPDPDRVHERNRKIVADALRGRTQMQIAAKFHISQTHVRYILNRYGVRLRYVQEEPMPTSLPGRN